MLDIEPVKGKCTGIKLVRMTKRQICNVSVLALIKRHNSVTMKGTIPKHRDLFTVIFLYFPIEYLMKFILKTNNIEPCEPCILFSL